MQFSPHKGKLVTVTAGFLAVINSLSVFAAERTNLELARTTTIAAVTFNDQQLDQSVAQNRFLLNAPGSLNKEVIAQLAFCGDGLPDPGEECDDGNLINGDGCNAACQVESKGVYVCTIATPGQTNENILIDGSFEYNKPAWTLNGSAFNPRCDATTCGPDLATDGEFYLWMGGGLFTAGNEATATQIVVIPDNATAMTFDWANGSNALPNGTCESPNDDFLEVLIDGSQRFRTANPCAETFPFETVTIDLPAHGLNDGLPHVIQFHGVNADAPANPGAFLTNFYLDNVRIDIPLDDPVPPSPSECFLIVCGDGILSGAEACDDGNIVDGDGCSSTCAVEEPDFVCTDPTLDSFDILADIRGDAIREGSLEDRRGRKSAEWEEVIFFGSENVRPICSEVLCPHSGNTAASAGVFYGLFGASTNHSNTAISQTVTIPTNASVLTFDFFVSTSSSSGPCDSTNDYLEVTVDGTEVFLYDCVAFVDEYTQQSVDISTFADGTTHTIEFRGRAFSANLGTTSFFVDNISIPLPTPAVSTPGVCVELPSACAPTEDFSISIPASWTVINLSADPNDGWGSAGDGICLSQNAAVLAGVFGDNLTSATGGAACADSDATGQVDINGGGAAAEMDTYLCSYAYDLTNITSPSFSFNTNYQAANNWLIDNGTPSDPLDEFDDDLLEVVVGTVAPNTSTIGTYTRVALVNDHEDGNLLLTGAQELSVNLEGSVEGQPEGYVCFHYKGTGAWFAQIDNATLRGENCMLAPTDTDGDGVFDSTDNCTLRPNADQRDTNDDGYGNICDPDTNNDGIVAFVDIASWVPLFNTACGDVDEDFNGDGFCNFGDFALFPQFFIQPPGPGAIDQTR